MDINTLREFECDIRKSVDGFSVKWKNESLTQKTLGKILFFNPKYLTSYVTTFYPSVYFPSQSNYEKNVRSSLTILAHERVHLLDSVYHGVWFKVSYLLPQILVIPLIASIVFCVLIGSVSASIVLALLSLVSLLPWPSPWRVAWEKRGYAMTLAMNYWMFGSIPEPLKLSVKNHFLDWSYYRMSWGSSDIEAWLNDLVIRIEDESILTDEVYREVHSFMLDKGLISK